MFGRPERRGFDTALICENRHVITSALHLMPEDHSNFCSICGAKTTSVCQNCQTPIRGLNLDSSVFGIFLAPAYCHNCGKPYIWTEKAQQSILEYADEMDELDEND